MSEPGASAESCADPHIHCGCWGLSLGAWLCLMERQGSSHRAPFPTVVNSAVIHFILCEQWELFLITALLKYNLHTIKSTNVHFGHSTAACGILVLNQESSPRCLRWEHSRVPWTQSTGLERAVRWLSVRQSSAATAPGFSALSPQRRSASPSLPALQPLAGFLSPWLVCSASSKWDHMLSALLCLPR